MVLIFFGFASRSDPNFALHMKEFKCSWCQHLFLFCRELINYMNQYKALADGGNTEKQYHCYGIGKKCGMRELN